jgi:hypothetical protein
MGTPEETKRKSEETDGTASDYILGKCSLDGVDVVQGTETLTALALAYLWDDPINNNFDCPWEWRRNYGRRL